MLITPKPVQVITWNGSNAAELRDAVNSTYTASNVNVQIDPLSPSNALVLTDGDIGLYLYFVVGADDTLLLLADRPQVRPAAYVAAWFDVVPD